MTLQMDQRAAVRARQFLDDHWCPEHAHRLRPQAEPHRERAWSPTPCGAAPRPSGSRCAATATSRPCR
nr:hypothetical protein [Angustibacter aerolatus]